MADIHAHKCRKCGHVWKHQRQEDWTKQQDEKAHTCPECRHFTTSNYIVFRPLTRNEARKVQKLPLTQPESY